VASRSASAERDGLELDRRGDADPAIVLCTVLADAAAQNARIASDAA